MTRPQGDFEEEPTPPQRPHCPKCEMRMVTFGEPIRLECLRCGHQQGLPPAAE